MPRCRRCEYRCGQHRCGQAQAITFDSLSCVKTPCRYADYVKHHFATHDRARFIAALRERNQRYLDGFAIHRELHRGLELELTLFIDMSDSRGSSRAGLES